MAGLGSLSALIVLFFLYHFNGEVEFYKLNHGGNTEIELDIEDADAEPVAQGSLKFRIIALEFKKISVASSKITQ